LLKLYLTGSNPRAQPAVGNLRRICERELAGQYDLEIIDVLEHPQIAEDEKILATPTLIKQLPPPRARADVFERRMRRGVHVRFRGTRDARGLRLHGSTLQTALRNRSSLGMTPSIRFCR
jgi:circadian clock protein KaiB